MGPSTGPATAIVRRLPTFGRIRRISAAAFRLRENWGFINRHRGQYALAVALALAANYFLSFVGYLACCVGIFVTNFLVQLFQTHMLGQLCWYERVRASRLGSEYP